MFASLAASALVTAALAAPAVGDPCKDIVDTAVDAGSFNTLAAALTEAGLVDALKGDGPFTVFAPTDAAFAALPEGTVEALLRPENRERLIGILTYHVVPGKVGSAQVVELTGAATLNGQRLPISVADGAVTVGDATVTAVDVAASNGVIHVIDRVLLPSDKDVVDTAVEAGGFATLVAAVKAAGLVETLQGDGPFTILAPTEEAFAALPEKTLASLLRPENKDELVRILTHHVIPGRVYAEDALRERVFATVESSDVRFAVVGGEVIVGGAKVLTTDIGASNGVIHVIDAVIMPPRQDDMARAVNDLIDEAITLGAPLYNHGQQSACAAVYTVCARSLMTLPQGGLPAAADERLGEALARVERTHDAGERAWILREALDDVRVMPIAAMTMPPASPRHAMKSQASKASSCSSKGTNAW